MNAHSAGLSESARFTFMILRERLTNLLVRIAGASDPAGAEALTLRQEAEEILKDHPEWRDIANSYFN